MSGIERLGPWPRVTVTAFRDLGLSDKEIARYFQLDPAVVRQTLSSGLTPPPMMEPQFAANTSCWSAIG